LGKKSRLHFSDHAFSFGRQRDGRTKGTRSSGKTKQHGFQEARLMQGQQSSLKGMLTFDDAILAHLDSIVKGQADVSSLSHPSIVMVQPG
jgi:hypothetical protein